MPSDRVPTVTGQPVPGFPLEFEWQTGVWTELFDRHTDYIKNELAKAQAENRVIIYLSCPISSRGGGHYSTNIDIANYTARKLMMTLGTGFFILNPCQYQMESKEGTGLIKRHARDLEAETGTHVDVDRLMAETPPLGGDYMRMWTKVLVEDEYLKDPARRGRNRGGLFDAYHFLSPSDVRAFFTHGETTVTAGIEDYFARKYAMDLGFRTHFSPPFRSACSAEMADADEQMQWERLRKDFFRFYSVRASVYFSKGSHDEWNIWAALNRLRLDDPAYGFGETLAGFFEGLQIEPGAAETAITKGYAK